MGTYVSLHGRAFGFDSDTGAIVRNGSEGGLGDETVSAASTASNISPRGATTLGTTAAKDYTMDGPITGVRKSLTSLTTSTAIKTVTLASGTFQTTAGSSFTKLTFVGQGYSVNMQALSTSVFAVLSNQGVTLST